jgi:hypothetical protein
MNPKLNDLSTQVFVFELINIGIAAGITALAGANSSTILRAGLAGAGAATAGAFFLGSLGFAIDVLVGMSEKTPEQKAKEGKVNFPFTTTGFLAGSAVGSVCVGLGFFAGEAAPKMVTVIKEYLATP